MKIKKKTLAVTVSIAVASLTAFLAVAGSEHDGKSEQPVAWADVPAAVQNTITANAAGGAIGQVGTGTRHRKVFYDAHMIGTNGSKEAIVVTADGSLVEHRTEVAWNTLPAAVQSTITATANGATVDKVELESKEGQTLYEVSLTGADGKKTEIHVGQDGSLRDHKHGNHGE